MNKKTTSQLTAGSVGAIVGAVRKNQKKKTKNQKKKTKNQKR